MSSKPADPLQVMDDIEPMREMLRGVVAALMSDGFTDREAHRMTCAMWVKAMQQQGAKP